MVRINLKDIFKWAALVFFWLAGAGISTAAEYYVSTTGNDTTGNGAITTPYQTIQHVLDNLTASGDIITLRGGTYNENVRIRNANMTIRSKSDEWAVIQSVINCDDITIRRCEIYNSGRNAPDSAEAIDNVNGDRMLVQQCHS